MTPNYLFINELNHERISNYIQANSWRFSAAGAAGMCSRLHSINTGKVDAHDYTSQIIDKVKAIA